MGFVFNPWATPYLVHSVTYLTLAVTVYAVRPWRLRNRALGLVLSSEACVDALLVVQFTARSPEVSLAAQNTWIPLGGIMAVAYLLFLSTFDSPLVRPLATPVGRRLLFVSIPLAPLLMLTQRAHFTGDVVRANLAPWNPVSGPVTIILLFVIGAVGLFGLAVMASAYRRAPPGSATRDRLRPLVWAFVWRDIGWTVLYMGYPLVDFSNRTTEMVYLVYPLYELVFAGLLGFGMLRHEALRRQVGADDHDGPMPSDDDRTDRRLAAYRAAVETSLSDLDDPRERRMLARLRRDLRIGRAEADRILAETTHLRTMHEAERDGRYHVMRPLGSGGQGDVFLARDQTLDRHVVLKRPHRAPTHRNDTLREARAAAQVRHANVVQVYDVIADAAHPILVMEHVPGGTLTERLRTDGAMRGPDVRRLADDLLAGLQAIHAAGLVHGDLKPDNILLDADGAAKIADFGIARTHGDTTRRGTPGYAPAEVAAGRPADPRSDLWSVGAILHVALTGRLPVGRDDTPDTLTPEAILEHDVVDLPSGRLGEAIRQALSRDPAARFADAGMMRRALAEAGT